MKPRILLADNDGDLSEIYARFFSRHGFEVQTATGGTECMQKLLPFDPDLMILDAELQWGGVEGVVALLREQSAALRDPVILVTGDENPPDLSATLQLPVECCFTKPVSLERLLDAAQAALCRA